MQSLTGCALRSAQQERLFQPCGIRRRDVRATIADQDRLRKIDPLFTGRTPQQFEDLMTWMRAELARDGIMLNAVYHCPYHPVHGVGEYKREHEDRKPGAGMLRRASSEEWVDLSQSVLVGDRCSDIAAANAAGLKQAFLLRGTENAPCDGLHQVVESLAEVEQWLVSQS